MTPIWIAIVQHLLWASLLLARGDLRTTGLGWIIDASGGPRYAGLVLLVVAALALIPHFLRVGGISSLCCYIPQQILVTLGALHAAHHVFLEQYADNARYPWDFILADQSLQIILAIFHSRALLRHVRAGRGGWLW